MTNKSPEKLGRDPDAPTNVGPKIIRTREELAALDPDTIVTNRIPHPDGVPFPIIQAWHAPVAHRLDLPWGDPLVVIATGDQVRAARQALEDANDQWDLPVHRTEAGYPNCATCDGGGCFDCTDPA